MVDRRVKDSRRSFSWIAAAFLGTVLLCFCIAGVKGCSDKARAGYRVMAMADGSYVVQEYVHWAVGWQRCIGPGKSIFEDKDAACYVAQKLIEARRAERLANTEVGVLQCPVFGPDYDFSD